jgi:chromosomal replication initiation ATPase DnaA
MTYTLSQDDIRRARSIAMTDRRAILDIVNAVSEATGIPVSAITGYGRTNQISQARALISYIAHVDEGHSLLAIGLVLRKDHSSVWHGVQRERERRAAEMSVNSQLSDSDNLL